LVLCDIPRNSVPEINQPPSLVLTCRGIGVLSPSADPADNSTAPSLLFFLIARESQPAPREKKLSARVLGEALSIPAYDLFSHVLPTMTSLHSSSYSFSGFCHKQCVVKGKSGFT